MLHYDLHLFIHMSTSLEKILGSTTSIDSLLFSTRDCPPQMFTWSNLYHFTGMWSTGRQGFLYILCVFAQSIFVEQVIHIYVSNNPILLKMFIFEMFHEPLTVKTVS